MISISRDKDARGIFAELVPSVRQLVLTRAEPTRSADPAALAPLARAAGIPGLETRDDPAAALARAQELRSDGDLLVLTGSIYLAGEIRSRLS